MDIHDDEDTGLPWTAIVILGGLAILGAITLVQWVIGAVLGLIKLLILAVVVIAVGSLILGFLARR